ncbi:unnamed protein product [Pylaiella littoralis]
MDPVFFAKGWSSLGILLTAVFARPVGECIERQHGHGLPRCVLARKGDESRERKVQSNFGTCKREVTTFQDEDRRTTGLPCDAMHSTTNRRAKWSAHLTAYPLLFYIFHLSVCKSFGCTRIF